MRRLLLVLSVAAMMVVMAAVTAGSAFAVPPDPECTIGFVEAQDQAQGCFDTARETANDASSRNADFGLSTAHFRNHVP